MANVSMTQGLKMVGDRASGVAGAASAIAGMSFDDNSTFAVTDTSCTSTGGSPVNFIGKALDSVTGGSASSPYVVSHVATLATGDYNAVIRRVGLHNSNAPTRSTTTLMFGIDGFSLTKASTFSMVFTFRLSYT